MHIGEEKMSGILDFLSEHSVAEHKEYLNNLRLRYSILLKSEERLSGLTPTAYRKKKQQKSRDLGQLAGGV